MVATHCTRSYPPRQSRMSPPFHPAPTTILYSSGLRPPPYPAVHTSVCLLFLGQKRISEGLGAPRASLPSIDANNGENESSVSRKKARIFGGGPEDRASPCRLFSKQFERQNAEMEEMEFDFMFRHGTIVLRVQEDKSGNIVSEVGSYPVNFSLSSRKKACTRMKNMLLLVYALFCICSVE